nr:DUF4148 domain-containing protein [Paraburkholderia pallida]
MTLPRIISCTIAAMTMGIAAAAHAGTDVSLTRAQVYADLVNGEQAGYNQSSGDDAHYPDAIQAAEAKVASQQNEQAQAYGGVALGQSQTGAGAGTASMCVGPVSYCNLYSGS